MRKWMMMIGLLVALLAACAPATTGEPTVESDSEAAPTSSGSALNPVPGGDEDAAGYPAAADSAASGYPAPDEASPLLGEGYPAGTLVAPVEVDLGQLTPVAGDPTPRVMPSPGRPGGEQPIAQGLLLDAVAANLSQQFDIPAASITVVSVEACLLYTSRCV